MSKNTDPKAPREFWILGNEAYTCEQDTGILRAPDQVHVIEYSAYADLQEKLRECEANKAQSDKLLALAGKELEKQLSDLERIAALQSLCKELVEVIDKMNVHVSIEHDDECPKRFEPATQAHHPSECTCHVFAAFNARAKAREVLGEK
jgi:hypothetical protein